MPRPTFPAYLRELASPILPNLVRSWGSTMGFLSTALFVLAIFNRPLAAKAANWEGISPWFALVPLLGFVSYTLLLAGFKKHQVMENSLAESNARLDESRGALKAHAAAAAAQVAEAKTPAPASGSWTHSLKKLRQFAEAIDALFAHAPNATLPGAEWKSWVSSADGLMEQIGGWKSTIELPPQVQIAFDHPKQNPERADPSGPTEFVAAFGLLGMFEMAIDAARVELDREAERDD